MNDPVVIVSVARTPIGSMVGELSGFAGHQLGSHAIKAAVARAGIAPEQVQEVIMGCVLPAGQGQARRGAAALNRRDHPQQGLWLGHEGRHVRA
jgi:acetyl-CoA C-acetyltransferase